MLRCAYHWAEAQGYVRTPFHGGRIAGWKLVNSLTQIRIRLGARAANVVSVVNVVSVTSLSPLKSAAKTHDAEGITAISRWLSEATPPARARDQGADPAGIAATWRDALVGGGTNDLGPSVQSLRPPTRGRWGVFFGRVAS